MKGKPPLTVQHFADWLSDHLLKDELQRRFDSDPTKPVSGGEGGGWRVGDRGSGKGEIWIDGRHREG